MRVTVQPGDDPVALVRQANGESLVLVFAPGRDAVSQAMALAALGPLALECAPGTRVNAVVPKAGVHDGDIERTVRFLDDALATTGQVIELG